MKEITTLDKLKIGQTGLIIEMSESNSGVFQRMLELGIIEGTKITVLGFAPWGDPLRVVIGNSVWAIRKYEAALATVEVI